MICTRFELSDKASFPSAAMDLKCRFSLGRQVSAGNMIVDAVIPGHEQWKQKQGE